MKKNILFCALAALSLLCIPSCKSYFFRSNYKDSNSLIHATRNVRTKPFLKAHLKNGDVCILTDSWAVDTLSNTVSGKGTRYDFNRNLRYEGTVNLLIDSVAIFETNAKILNPEADRITALSIMSALDVAVGVICLTNPKACFGSCPTFYLNENNNFHFSDAEGFSNAIAPSMEYFDIDALSHIFIKDPSLTLTMKNEALETHCVNALKLLAYPLKEGERVYQSRNNEFYLCQNLYRLSEARALEGDVSALLKNEDKQERFSLSDPSNLSSKEELILRFDDLTDSEKLGLIINFRQSLMTTYFIYSAMGYMGDELGDIFAKIERDPNTKEKLNQGIKKELGDIDVYAWHEEKEIWVFQGGFYETGPIALNRQFTPLKGIKPSSSLKLKLVMNKGLWRLDFLALTNIKNKVEPTEIIPTSVLNKGKIDAKALNEINATNKHLISMPGSDYKFTFTLPQANTEYELFLYSKGYYLEWMREHWLKDKNLMKLKQMVDNPKKYLQEEAQMYKQYESGMEQEFWNSKIDTKNYSYYEK